MKETILDDCKECDVVEKDPSGAICKACLDEKAETRRRWREEQMDMNRCPDCGEIQPTPRKKGEECITEDCECYVLEYRGELIWTNPNWG